MDTRQPTVDCAVWYRRLQKRDESESALRISVSWHGIYMRAKVNLYLRQRQSIHCFAVSKPATCDRCLVGTYIDTDAACISAEQLNMEEPWHQPYFSRRFIVSEKYRVMIRALEALTSRDDITGLIFANENKDWASKLIFFGSINSAGREILIKSFASFWQWCEKRYTKTVFYPANVQFQYTRRQYCATLYRTEK